MSNAKFCLCSVSVNITANRLSLLHLRACTWQWQSLVGKNDIFKRFTKVFDFSLLSSMVIGSLGNSPVLSLFLFYLNCVTSKEQVENGMLRSIWRLKVRTGTPTRRPIHHRTDLTRLFVLTYTHILMPSPETTGVEAPCFYIEDIKGFNRTVHFSLKAHRKTEMSWESKDTNTVEIKFYHWESGRARIWMYWRLMSIEHGHSYRVSWFLSSDKSMVLTSPFTLQQSHVSIPIDVSKSWNDWGEPGPTVRISQFVYHLQSILLVNIPRTLRIWAFWVFFLKKIYFILYLTCMCLSIMLAWCRHPYFVDFLLCLEQRH